MKKYAIKCADTYSVLNKQSEKRKYWKEQDQNKNVGKGVHRNKVDVHIKTQKSKTKEK